MSISAMTHLIRCRLQHNTRHIASITCHVQLFSTSSVNPILGSSNSTDPHSLTVSYLLKSCGLSLESAIEASKKLHFEKTDQPDSVLNLFKTHGLTQTHIKILITKRPQMLLADPHNTLKPNIELFESLGFCGINLVSVLRKAPRVLETDAHTAVGLFRTYGLSEKQISSLIMKCPAYFFFSADKTKPKLEFFKSLGFTDKEIPRMLSYEPYILGRSLENHLIPSVQVIRRLVGSDENVLKTIKAWYPILKSNLHEFLEQNFEILLNRGVPKSLIQKWFMYQPKTLLIKIDRFSEIVSEVEKRGFSPTNPRFMVAIYSMAGMSKSLWERKLGLYSSFGWSQDDLIAAFKLQPMFMITSERKIRKSMGFFVNQLKLKPEVISKHPNLLLLSLEKRIVPRCSVLQLLMSKNLIQRDINLPQALVLNEKEFMARFMSKYQHVIPEVVDARQGKIKFQGFPIMIT